MPGWPPGRRGLSQLVPVNFGPKSSVGRSARADRPIELRPTQATVVARDPLYQSFIFSDIFRHFLMSNRHILARAGGAIYVEPYMAINRDI